MARPTAGSGSLALSLDPTPRSHDSHHDLTEHTTRTTQGHEVPALLTQTALQARGYFAPISVDFADGVATPKVRFAA